MTQKKLSSAVLFIIFNRIDATKVVFDSIQKAKPPRLYIAADGPRPHEKGEDSLTKQVREYVLAHINWPCQVETLFSDTNNGCKNAVSSAISWFFENEEMGIILEDDCLPSQSFFWFCEEMLHKYKENDSIWMISGANISNTWKPDKYDYFYSQYGGIWGWATWAKSWKYYDPEIKVWASEEAKLSLKKVTKSRYIFHRWESVLNKTFHGQIDTWDYQWQFIKLINNALTIVPSKNLVKNIGFGENATHTKDVADNRSRGKIFEIDSIAKCPKNIEPDMQYDLQLLGIKNRLIYYVKEILMRFRPS